MRPAAKKYVVIGYVGGFRGEINTDIIDVKKLTHINYAFVNVQSNRAHLTNLATDSVNFRKLNALKKINPDLKILISIGGWAWSENFSDAMLTDTARAAFARSAVDIMQTYKLDGVDIDWEYPTIPGEAGNVYRPEDKQNFTLMFRDVRQQLDSLTKLTSHKYLLTTAVGGFTKFIENTEMAEAAKYLDLVNLMTYDYSGSGTAGHHTNLFASGANPAENSADRAVREYIAAGVPASKLVMGIAFYGRSWILSGNTEPVMNNAIVSTSRGGGHTYLKDSLVNKNGYKRYWDNKANAPYLFNSNTKQFISYDDEQSVKAKCDYVRKYNLAGVMFWEYSSDPQLYLLKTINGALR
ncbi:MAG: glycoside hydrolase family 18 protein [Chitinophagaceae bacterium]|nr:MAG: glycoside hydrolase family 18 protein [Chitinophagaceae bacterium]